MSKPILAFMLFALASCGDPKVTDPCPGGICVGPDAQADTPPTCDNSECVTPPSACHESVGLCVDGACSYTIVAGKPCDDNNACTEDDRCDSGGVCVGSALVCDVPPAPTCLDGDTSEVYNAQGVCAAGECTYSSNTVSCPGKCGADTPGVCSTVCDRVTCTSPPSSCHVSPGICGADGACSYEVDSGAACDTNGCVTGQTCSADGTCAGGTPTVCDVPPASATCVDADTSRVYDPIGTCSAGNCSYTFNDISCPGQCGANEPGLCPDACAGVVCQSPPSPCHQPQGTCSAGQCTYAPKASGDSCDDGDACTQNDTCQNGVCQGTSVSCDSPPAPICDDADTSWVYNQQGSCTDGQCSYSYNVLTCTGQCGSSNPGECPGLCDLVVCDSPPNVCYQSSGTCLPDGSCQYAVDPAATTCDDSDPCTVGDACSPGGSCQGTPMLCSSPPPPACADPSTVRVYTASGASCSAGACTYPFTDTPCPAGCANGACVGGCDESTCTSWKPNDPPDGQVSRTCGDAACATTAALPNLDLNYFRCNIQPIFDAHCSQPGCHSTVTPLRRLRLYSQGLDRVPPIHPGSDIELITCGNPGWAYAALEFSPLTTYEKAWNFDSARMFALEAADPASSELATQPLKQSAGGLPHDGYDILVGTNDKRYGAIVAWLNGATDTPNCDNRNLPIVSGMFGKVKDLNDYGCPQCLPGAPGAPDPSPPCDPSACCGVPNQCIFP